ncbi:MAG: bifunctional UDP-N-acetylglucosamine diphosphorylase/glucosamine-1-phosphate N-acetyltransferase GlmU [Myxococcales bacterium]|nr:bifunctional UDP-N-acetylglucosamine diphosphorylase/glucosamine-1-phosphate N-acetyltransferase GlmU [Myxococcales bacterium]
MTQRAKFSAIVMAAGQGTRMHSDLPKVLHPLLGRPMVSFPVSAALEAGAERVVVVLGHGRDAVSSSLAERFDGRVVSALQEAQRGTGDAARCALPALEDIDGRVVILCGDTPLLTSGCVGALVDRASAEGAKLAMLTSVLDDASGYGRIIRDGEGHITAIREHRDCSEAERAIGEWNPGVFCVEAGFLRATLDTLSADNDQGELYLTDLVERAAGDSRVAALPWPAADLHGINDRNQLIACERILRLRQAEALGRAGVTLRDPEGSFIDADVQLGRDVTLEAGVQLRGKTRIGDGVHIDVGCVLTNVTVATGTRLLPYTVASDSQVGAGAQLGPFSHLRPGNELGDGVRIGNFVELKKIRMDQGSKANHLAYLGDGDIGRGVNVGAGTIFCNYDGVMKHKTVLEDGVFIGSDSQLVAPITIGKDAYVATGTTVTQDVPSEALAIGRARQQNKAGLATRLWQRLRAQAARAKK